MGLLLGENSNMALCEIKVWLLQAYYDISRISNAKPGFIKILEKYYFFLCFMGKSMENNDRDMSNLDSWMMAHNNTNWIMEQKEASSHDRINMTQFGLEHDQKKFTLMNVNLGTWPKNWHWWMLTIEHDQIYI